MTMKRKIVKTLRKFTSRYTDWQSFGDYGEDIGVIGLGNGLIEEGWVVFRLWALQWPSDLVRHS